MALPLAKHKGQKHMVATAETLIKLLQLVKQNLESAEYYAKQHAKSLDGSSLEKSVKNDLKQADNNFVHEVSLQEKDRENPWNGVPPKNKHQTYQANALEEAAAQQMSNALPALPKDQQVVFGYSIDKNANYAGGFIAGEEPIDLSRHFNAWLGEHGYGNTGEDPESGVRTGVIVKLTGTGSMMMDDDGEPLRANDEELKRLINGEIPGEEGFADYLQKQEPSITVVSHCFSDKELEHIQQEAFEPEAAAPTSGAAEVTPDESEPGMSSSSGRR